jgi:hypothetical protein
MVKKNGTNKPDAGQNGGESQANIACIVQSPIRYEGKTYRKDDPIFVMPGDLARLTDKKLVKKEA